jgi:hypothetical protein
MLDRRPAAPRPRRVAVTLGLGLAALLLCAGPLAAYTIYLKDGSRIVARDKYEVVDGRAYITLPSGTRTVIDAAEIDVPRTEKANEINLGTAMVLEDGAVKEPTKREAPQERKTLADLIAHREGAPPELPGHRRAAPVHEPEAFVRTGSGWIDLLSVPRRPFSALEISSALVQLFRGHGIDQIEVYQGTQAGRPLLDVTTNSEAAVFRAVAVSASALVHLRDRYPGKAEALELVMTTPARERAGQFVIDPEMARGLLAKEVDLQTFYLAHLQF